ncbi:MAG TPA: heme-binding domain-containing protein [Kofleriaceae bacterium]|nr:heme-binding domain-containing protein [Kofleriaceae bacterium]
MHRSLRRLFKGVVLGLAFFVGFVGVLQLVPYGRAHSNPPVVQEPRWDQPRTRELAKRACFDCHSNETRWPWYSHLAPFSWTLQRDVEVGRSVLNFSEWNRSYELAHEAGPTVIRRDMPPSKYTLMHGDADLTEDEKVELARGLHATFGAPGRI